MKKITRKNRAVLLVIGFVFSFGVVKAAGTDGGRDGFEEKFKTAAMSSHVKNDNRDRGEKRHKSGNKFKQKKHRRDAMSSFRNNLYDHPVKAARSLLRVLSKLDSSDIDNFVDENCGNIVKLLDSLERVKKAEQIKPKAYDRVAKGLSKYGIAPNQIMMKGLIPASKRPSSDAGKTVRALMKVRESLNDGASDIAFKQVERLQVKYPKKSSVLATVSEYYNEMSRFSKAEESASGAIKINPKNTDAYKARAMARVNMDDRKGAIEDVKRAMELDPQDESAKILSILIESKKEAPDLKTVASIEAMKKAVNAHETDAVSFEEAEEKDIEGLGKSNFTNKNLTGDKTVAAHFSSSKLFLKKAASKNNMGDYSNAIKYATRAIKEDGGNMSAYLERAIARNFIGHYDEAISDSTNVLNRDRKNIQALNIRSWALNKKGKFDSAGRDATRAIGLNSGFADAWLNRAMANEKMGNYKQMLKDYEQAAILSENYRSQYQDAVAQYSSMVPGFAAGSFTARNSKPVGSKSPLKKFFVLMAFTITGGLLIGFGFFHMASGKLVKKPASGIITQLDELSPEVFHEGVASGKYKIEKKIGTGGMGMVYLAVDQTLERKVAIKKMNEEIKTSAREKQRFLQEARMVALLHHPNIVEIYTIFEEDDNVYLVFEYVDGKTLDVLVDSEVRLSFEKTKKMFDAVAKALTYAHDKNIVHRDLKLSNIMITGDGFVKVMDFGLARQAMESMSRLSSVEVVGSPAYMAPEQDKGASGKQCDIFSLGVCLYEALTGILPFNGPDFHYQKEQKLFSPVSSISPGAPDGVDELINKSLAPDPNQRFKSIEEWREAFLAIH